MLKKLFRNPLFITVFGGIVSTVASSLIVSKVQSISIVDAIGTVVGNIYRFLIKVLLFEIPVWIILVGIALIIFALYIVAKIQDSKVQNPIQDYTEDIIDGIRWQWNWINWQRTNIFGDHILPTPICINCEGNLVVNKVGYGEHLICRHCGFDKHMNNEYTYYHDYIRNEIVRRIRLKEKEQKQASK